MFLQTICSSGTVITPPTLVLATVIVDPHYLSCESRTSLPSLANVPTHLLDAVNKSFSMHKDNRTLHSVMADTLQQEITFQDFCVEINRRANNKSPGPSGFTINMLKSLPTAVLEQLFAALLTVWNSPNKELVPTSWYTRWLCSVLLLLSAFIQ